MPINFPDSPTNGQVFRLDARTWTYNSTSQSWDLITYGQEGPGAWIYGGGMSGDVTVSGSITLTRDAHYRNLTLVSGAAITTNGFRIFVSGTLDLSQAPAGAIRFDGLAGGDGSGASGGGGAGTGGATYPVLIRPTGGHPAASAGTGAGNNGGVGVNWLGYSSTPPSNGGGGNAITPAGGINFGGFGGAGSGNIWNPINYNLTGPITVMANSSGGNLETITLGNYTGGGASGGGDGTNSGGGGGGGGGSGGCIYIAANIINRGTNTTAGIIRAIGGRGGNGATRTVGNVGGGGGGGGGSGGCIMILYRSIIGSTIPEALDVTGGVGGNGGAGAGRGTNGNGAGGGTSGSVIIQNADTGVNFCRSSSAATSVKTGGDTIGNNARVIRWDL